MSIRDSTTPLPDKPIPGLAYLASPYTHDDQAVVEQRFQIVSATAAQLMKDGWYIYAPISHSHPISKYGLPTDWAFWKKYDTILLERSDHFIVVDMEGLEESVGVTAEAEIWLENHDTIYSVPPVTRLDGDFASDVGWTPEYGSPALSPAPCDQSILEEALALVSGERQKAYGPPSVNFKRISKLLTSHFEPKLKPGSEISMRDVTHMMILIKLARDIHSPKRDNAVDIAGYAQLMDMF